MSNLILHCGAEKVGREALYDTETPDGTRTWCPVPHHHAATLAVEEAGRRGYTVESEEYGLNPAGTKMFGVLRFHPDGHPEWSRALGIRNSHDKSLAFGLTCGLSIMVCDNLCFGGETTVHRKHTNGIDIEALIPQAFERLDDQYARLEDRIGEMKGERITKNGARLLAVRAAEQRVIPSCDILPVVRAFENPEHESFEDTTKWSLYNSFTAVAKKYSAPRADVCYRQLAKFFSLN